MKEALKAPDYSIFFEDEDSVMNHPVLGAPDASLYSPGDGIFDMASPIPGRTMAMTMTPGKYLRVHIIHILKKYTQLLTPL